MPLVSYNLLWAQTATNVATEANHVVHDGKLKKGSIVRLKQYQANSVKGKRFVDSYRFETRELMSAES